MHFNKRWDLLLNILAPLAFGIIVYWLGDNQCIPSLIHNYLPDGLWAYAFMSAILLVWDRQLNMIWIIAAVLLSGGYELLQNYHIVAGTGDWNDILVYAAFFTIALLLNSLFKGSILNTKLQKQL